MQTPVSHLPLRNPLLFASTLLISLFIALAVFAAEDRPNIILCMADDQGWGDVGYNGNDALKTPTLDEMAALGLRFDRFYAAAPVCSPTRGSVMTGRHPNRFGCFTWGYPLKAQEVTLAEALRKAGYVTGHFGKWHLGDVGADSPDSPGNSGFDRWVSSPNFYENNPLMSDEGKVVQLSGEGSEATVRVALEFIREAVLKEQLFLAVIWFGSPHTPHEATERERLLYQDQPPALREYFGEITAMDRAVGQLRRELRDLGVADNTLLWYTSDNGAHQPGSTGGLRGQKGTLWEGGIRVPAIIEWPARIRSPRATDVPCGTVDIYPTLIQLTGARVANQPKPLDGISLLPLLDGQLTSRNKPLGFWEYPAKGNRTPSTELLQALAREQATGQPAPPSHQNEASTRQAHPLDERPGHAAWIDGGYKLHRLSHPSSGETYQLYNLEADPKEQKDVAQQHPEQVRRMRQALDKWQESVLKSLNGADYSSE